MILPDPLKRICACYEAPLLKTITTAGVGGRAPWLLAPFGPAEMAEAVAFMAEEGIPFRLIGGGSDILAGDGGIGDLLVSTRRLSGLERLADGEGLVRAGAGVPLPRLVSFCAEKGLSGAEALAGIPGTVGGAVAVNAGGRHGDVASIFVEARVLDREGRLRAVGAAESSFGYRKSSLRSMVVLDVLFRLDVRDEKSVFERTAKNALEKARNQPLKERSCGCIFRNPPGFFAGKLLDEAGLKGSERGGARISPVHANFMINKGGASCRDFDFLIRSARGRVRELFDVDLDLEIVHW